MKLTRLFYVFAASAVALTACQKAAVIEDAAQTGEGKVEHFIFSVNLPDNTKTQLGEKTGTTYPILWSTGDVLTLNGTPSSPLAEGGSKSAVFEFEGVFTKPYNILYGGKSGSSDVVTFPSVQTYSAGTFDPKAAPMYSTVSDGTPINVAPANALVRFLVKGDATIKRIVLIAKGGEKIAGDFKIGTTEGKLNGTLTAQEGASSSLVLDLGEDGVLLTADATPFFISIPAGTYSAGFSAYAIDGDNHGMEMKFATKSAKTFAAAKVYELGEIEFVPDNEVSLIYNEADLKFALAKSKDKTAKCRMINDIDISDKWVSASDYYGEFDGDGHSITGLKTPLLGNFYGIAKNVKLLDAEINYEGVNGPYGSGTDYGVGILAHYAYISQRSDACIDGVETSGSIQVSGKTASAHAFNIGGILGASNGVPISNCVNGASVTVTEGYTCDKHSSGDTEFNLLVGGISGISQTAATASLTNCVNNGKVTVLGSTGEHLYVGGITSRTVFASKIMNCTNNGDLEIKPTSAAMASYYGGVIGYESSGVLADCTNKGAVSVGGTCGSNVYVGGISGHSIVAASRRVTNNGDILVDSLSCSYVFTGGVVGFVSGQANVNLYNYGDITVKNVKNTAGTGIAVGGISGQRAGQTASLADSENHGNITIGKNHDDAVSGRKDIGGITGYDYYSGKANAAGGRTYTNVKNYGSVTVNDITQASTARIGGFVGYAYLSFSETPSSGNTFTLSNCTNEGAVTVTAGVAKDLFVAGMVADASIYGAISISGSSNKGGLTVNGFSGTNGITGGLVIGGIVGKDFFSKSGNTLAISNCSNSGRIYLSENVTDSNRPCAGGIVGLFASSSVATLPAMTISNCESSGNIVRTLTGVGNNTLAVNGSNNYYRVTVAGGIVGSIGYFYEGGITYTYVSSEISECRNKGAIAFNRKPSLGSTVSCEKNNDGENVYQGGIVGMSYSASSSVIRSCINDGNILSTYGKDGGIVGMQRKNTKITGTKDSYTINNGRVHHQSSTISSPGTPYGYCGGISGYMFGDGTNEIEYCANYGTLASNYGAGGLLGQLGSKDSYNIKGIHYCKINCKSRASSSAPATYGFGKTAQISGASVSGSWANVSDIAVCGSLYKADKNASDAKWTLVTLTESNYFNYLGAITYQPSQEDCVTKNILYWDGKSKTSWE